MSLTSAQRQQNSNLESIYHPDYNFPSGNAQHGEWHKDCLYENIQCLVTGPAFTWLSKPGARTKKETLLGKRLMLCMKARGMLPSRNHGVLIAQIYEV